MNNILKICLVSFTLFIFIFQNTYGVESPSYLEFLDNSEPVETFPTLENMERVEITYKEADKSSSTPPIVTILLIYIFYIIFVSLLLIFIIYFKIKKEDTVRLRKVRTSLLTVIIIIIAHLLFMAILELYALLTNTELIFQSITTEWFIGIVILIYLINSSRIKEERKSLITVIDRFLHLQKNTENNLKMQK